jgi:hypothetical protein
LNVADERAGGGAPVARAERSGNRLHAIDPLGRLRSRCPGQDCKQDSFAHGSQCMEVVARS